MVEPNGLNGIQEELARQEATPWERGKFLKSYELVLGDYTVRSALEHAKPPSLLDVACGNGLLTNMLAPHFSRAVGLDASLALIEKASECYPGIEFVHTLAEEYRTDELFTTITMFDLLEHVVDPVSLLSSVVSHLDPEGVLIVHVPNALAVNRRIAKLMGALEDEHELSPFDMNIAGHRRSYDMQMLLRHVEASGLRVVDKGGIFYKMLSAPQLNWLLEQGLWEKGGYGWGRVGSEKVKDWRKAFCDACYEFGKDHPEDCNLVYAVIQR